MYQVVGQREKAQTAFRQAAAVFDRLVHDCPDDATYPRELASALYILAEDLYQAGQIAEANAYYLQSIRVLRAAARSHPADPETTWILAISLCLWFDPALRDTASAVEPARKAVELTPHLPKSWMALGIAYYRTGQWDAAATALQEALQLSMVERKFDRTLASFFLAMAQWRCGRQPEARQAYQQAVQRMEKSFAARDSLDRAIQAEAVALLGIAKQPAAKAKEEAPRTK